MDNLTRRTFLKRAAWGAGTALALAPHARVLGANEDLRVAVVGFRSQGSLHIRLLRELPQASKVSATTLSPVLSRLRTPGTVSPHALGIMPANFVSSRCRSARYPAS